jgi:hypothetical protein
MIGELIDVAKALRETLGQQKQSRKVPKRYHQGRQHCRQQPA